MRAAVVPHAPVLIERVAGTRAGAASKLRAALDALAANGAPQRMVVVSPHASQACVYARAAGSLDDFGVRGVDACASDDEDMAALLAASWPVPLLEAPADHGIVVPLALLRPTARVAAAGLPECTGPGAGQVTAALDAARALAAALATIEPRPALFFSAHTSAALTAAAPLAERDAGKALHERIVAALREDVGALASIPASWWEEGGSCGAGPLTALGLLFRGPAEVLADEAPFGVGYVVAALP